MAGTWNKREREQKKKNAKKQKEEKRQERKENSLKGKGLDEMMAYVDEYGNLSDTPPDKNAKPSEIIPPTVANSNALLQADPVRKGMITFFDDSKGYGFIRDAQTQESIFVHVNSSAIDLKEGIKVNFEVQRGPKGLAAVNVKAGV